MAQLENFRLKVFRAVAEHLNFHKAAEHLFLTQPAVTLQIKALEEDVGVRLFDRAAGRISLTRQGSILRGYATKMASLAAEAGGLRADRGPTSVAAGEIRQQANHLWHKWRPYSGPPSICPRWCDSARTNSECERWKGHPNPRFEREPGSCR